MSIPVAYFIILTRQFLYLLRRVASSDSNNVDSSDDPTAKRRKMESESNGELWPVHNERLQLQKIRRKQLDPVTFLCNYSHPEK